MAAAINQITIKGIEAPKINTSKNIKLERVCARGSIAVFIDESISKADAGNEKINAKKMISLLLFIN